MREAELIYSASETDANLFHATRFLAGDPVIFLRIGRRKMLVLNDLEIGRGRDQARVDEILSLSEIQRRVGERASTARVIEQILRDRGVRRVVVPAAFPLELADQLRARRLRVIPRPAPFYPERIRKTPEEVRWIEATQRAVEAAVEKAIDLLRRAKVRGNKVIHQGEVVTSESLKKLINVSLMERNCVAKDTIAAPGDQGCDPHHQGTGPIRPDRTLILDVFPRSGGTRYFADMTRTVVKGKASPAVKRMYAAVKEAQEAVFSFLRHGADGRALHREVQDVFKDRGYKTGPRGGKREGFFHGTGHGVGLDIHEAPSIGLKGTRMEAGAVVTVEPGLYYPGVGGVRLEDMVLVTRTGCRNLTRFPKELEV
jgi:Xaa-Pro aminopeptidase